MRIALLVTVFFVVQGKHLRHRGESEKTGKFTACLSFQDP